MLPPMLEPRSVCPRCLRPAAVCYCDQIPRLETRTRVIVLQHPRERRVPIGTGRMASLCLPNSRLFVGLDFAEHSELNAALSDPRRPAALLFPTDSVDLAASPPPGPISLVLLDGTWSQAKKLLKLNPRLASLPRYSLSPPPSEYVIRAEPARDYVSTLEALFYSLAILEGDPARCEALLAPFRRMVALQVEYRERLRGGVSRHARRWEGSNHKPARLPAELTERWGDLVCIAGEANAWSTSLPGAHPEELVHWLGCRVATGELFEALVAPRNPLAPSTPVHTRLDPAALAAGLDARSFAARWQGFGRPNDILCSWGVHPLKLAGTAGLALPEARIDLRKVVGDLVRGSPGAAKENLERWGLESAPLGLGRGGERLGELVEVVRHLSNQARSAGGVLAA